MTWSQKRQITFIGVLVIIVASVVGYGTYRYFKTEPTCFDGKMNGTETGIDCGGACTRVCEGRSRSLVLLWARSFEVTPGVYNVVAYFENQNVTTGIEQLQYELKLYDAENILVADPYRGTTFVGPNQRTAVFVSGIQTGNRIPATVFFNVINPPVWDTVDPIFSSPLVTARNQLYQNLTTSAKVTTELVNNSFYDLRSIPVVAVLYDAKGNAFAASQTFVDVLPQGMTTPLTFTWLAPFAEAPARIEIIPRVNPFIRHNR